MEHEQYELEINIPKRKNRGYFKHHIGHDTIGLLTGGVTGGALLGTSFLPLGSVSEILSALTIFPFGYVTIKFLKIATQLLSGYSNRLDAKVSEISPLNKRTNNELNQIIVFSNGAMYPLYTFIDYTKSTRNFLVMPLIYPYERVDVIENYIIKHPETEEDMIHNADVTTVRNTYPFKSPTEMYHYLDEKFSDYDTLKEQDLEMAYAKRLDENAKRNVIETDGFNPEAEQMKRLKETIDNRNHVFANDINELEKEQKVLKEKWINDTK